MLMAEITQLIERCRQGDADALGELYKAYAPRMKGVCRRYVSDEGAVNDVLHDAFVIIFTSFDKLRDDTKAEAWMMGITRNVALKYNNQQPTLSLEETSEAELQTVEDEEKEIRGVPWAEVVKLIDNLPRGYGQVFRLSVFEGMTHKEIAAMLGIEPHSSSSQLARAKKMMRKMMRQYWAVLMLITCFLMFFLLRRGDTTIKERRIIICKTVRVIERGKQRTWHQKPVTVRQRSTSKETCQTVDSVTHDSLSEWFAGAQNCPDTLQADTGLKPSRRIEVPHKDITHIALNHPVIGTSRPQRWSLDFAYAAPMGKQMANQPYGFTETPLISPTGEPPSPITFENWSDYAAYLSEFSGDGMSVLPADEHSHTRSIIMNIVLNNANQPAGDKILRRSHHYMPTTWSLALRYHLTERFGLEFGLGYSRLSSDFEIGTDGNAIREQQTIHYLGIPVKGIYDMYKGRGLSLYGSMGLTAEFPVGWAANTSYYLHGTLEASEKQSLRVPWQWSVGGGLGVQYNFTPHIGFFAEPSLQYYIPTGSGIETYRTEHPFTFSLPIGIRFTW